MEGGLSYIRVNTEKNEKSLLQRLFRFFGTWMFYKPVDNFGSRLATVDSHPDVQHYEGLRTSPRMNSRLGLGILPI
jgi:hypothetical protein